MARGARFGPCLIAVALAAGCVRPHPSTLADRYVIRGTSAEESGTTTPDLLASSSPETRDAIASALAAAREEAAAKPPALDQAESLEQRDPELATARLQLVAFPTAASHRRVGAAYARLGVFDQAFDHFTSSIALEPRDANGYEGRARVWRDWDLPQWGLSDAYRAIAYAPALPGPRNTLGTLLLDMDLLADAQTAFELARALDPGASYALNNLCYVLLLRGETARAIAACEAVLREAPELAAARNNLALAYAAAGDWSGASATFAAAGDEAAARYNMGVALMATRHFAAAARAFDDAFALSPRHSRAKQRAKDARRAAAAIVEP